MIFFLVGLILALFFSSLYLNYDFYKQKKLFKSKMLLLENTFEEQNQTKVNYKSNIEIMNMLEQNMKRNTKIVHNEIYNLNFELFEIAIQKKS
ncbi:MAG: hypothetical protein H7239_10535 [Flavobacterium sp.]|nr:hypothetical protein [Flavobacterium sp.]